MSVSADRKLVRLDLAIERGDLGLASELQYRLLTTDGVWRAFLNSYTGKGFIVFDPEVADEEKLMETLKPINAEVVKRTQLTVGELVESSYSWNNILERT